MRMFISSLAALMLSLSGTSGLTSSAVSSVTPALIAAAPAALVFLASGKAEAQRRRAGARSRGHRAGVRSPGRHSVNRRVHSSANRPHRARPEYRRRDYRRPYHGHYSRRDVYHHYDRGYRRYYDGYRWGTGLAAATAASLAVGAVVASLPPNCTGVTVGGAYYQRCDGRWLAPQYAGSDVTYVVVEDPR